MAPLLRLEGEEAGKVSKCQVEGGSRAFTSTFRQWEALKGQLGCKVEKASWGGARPAARKQVQRSGETGRSPGVR